MSKYVKKKNELYSGYGLNCVPKNSYVEVLTPSASGRDCVWGQSLKR